MLLHPPIAKAEEPAKALINVRLDVLIFPPFGILKILLSQKVKTLYVTPIIQNRNTSFNCEICANFITHLRNLMVYYPRKGF
jgi:hypothetical protein